MKQKILIVLIALVGVFCIAFVMAACSDDDKKADACTHSYTEWEEIVPATCTSNGYKSRECTICGNVENDFTAALRHDWETEWEEVVPATCTSMGYSLRECIDCGIVEYDFTAALGHDWETEWEEVVPATCTSMGYSLRECINCGIVEYDFTAALGHDWGIAYTLEESTCTEDGTELVKCSVCEAVEMGVIARTGHSSVEIPAVEADCETAGHTAGTKCSVCGEFLSGNEPIPALGHKLGENYTYNQIYHYNACTNCKREFSDMHNWVDNTCTVCNAHLDNNNYFGNGYAFEAEYTDLTGKEGAGYAGSAMGTELIVQDDNSVQASNGYYVDYLYVTGMELTFVINAAEETFDAALVLRIAASINFTLTDEIYGVYVNEVELTGYNYALSCDIINGSNTFDNYLISSSVHLRMGQNIIRLVVENNLSWGGTTQATAPIVDCIYIYTDVELSWGECYPENVGQTEEDVDYEIFYNNVIDVYKPKDAPEED